MIPRVLPSAPPGRPAAARAGAAPPYAPAGPASGAAGRGGAGPGGAPAPAGPPRQAPAGRAAAATGPGRVSSLDAQRTRRRRWVGGLAVAAVAAAVATFSIIGLNANKSVDSGQAQAGVTITQSTTIPPPGNPAPQAFTIQKGQFQEAFSKVEGTKAGALSNPITLASCVGENGITLSDVLGVSNVTYESKAAYAIAVTVPNDNTKARLLVVGVTCGPGGAQLLAEETVVR